MLIFCNNYLSGQALLHDTVLDKTYKLLNKNGSSSLRNLASRFPERYRIEDYSMLQPDVNREITVFIRDPVERFVSGIETQMQKFQIPLQVIENIINKDKELVILDGHTAPQFWSLMKLGKNYPVTFKFLPMSELGSVDQNIKRINSSPAIPRINLSDDTIEAMKQFYAEDFILYRNFLNKTVSFNEIVQQIKTKTGFVENYLEYKDCLTYLF